MKTILSVEKSPYITARQSNALQLSVIQAIPADITPWLCSQFVNLAYKGDSPLPLDILREDFWFTKAKLTSRQYMNLSTEVMDYASFDVIAYISSALDRGMYVMGDFNAYYIREKPEYRIVNKKNDYLIHGYDSYDKLFYMLGYTKDKHFGDFTVPYDEYLESIKNRTDKIFNLSLFEVNPNFDFSLSLKDTYKKLKDYLLSERSEEQRYKPGVAYGLGALEQFWKESKADYMGRDRYFDYLSFLALMEHKQLMCVRMQYLYDSGIVSDKKIVDLCIESYLCAEDALKICGEYNSNRELSGLENLDSDIKRIIGNDRDMLNIALDNIGNYQKSLNENTEPPAEPESEI